MRIRSRKNLKKKNCVIVFLFLLPLIGFGGFAGFLLYILNDVASYTYVMPTPDTQYFNPLDKIDTDYFTIMAENYEIQMETYHMLYTNISLDIVYKDYNYNRPG